MRRSHWGRFPHFLYMEHGRMVSFVPVNPKHKQFPPPLFTGKVRRGDLVAPGKWRRKTRTVEVVADDSGLHFPVDSNLGDLR